MNDRNAFLQGQGSPIKDDAAPPENGWRGERSADEVAGTQSQRRHIPGVGPEVEEISGTAFAEAQGLDPNPQDEDQEENRTLPGLGIQPKSTEAILPSYLWRYRPAGQFTKLA